MDYSTLSRLGAEGLAAVPQDQLTTLDDSCQDWAEATGDARYCFIAKVLSAVDSWREEHDEAGGVPEDLLAEDGGVIVHTDGRPVDAARWGHYMRAARKHAGVSDRVSFHDLRHFFASALIAAGCTVKQVKAALGHESANVTLDVYGHLWPGDEDRVGDAIDRLGTGAAKDLRRTTA